jgi:taurine--2-oxoglutarate transaminase
MKTDTKTTMDGQEMVDLCKKHTFFSWSAQNAVNPIPWSKAEGIYFWDTDGKRYTDLSSQLVSTNLGYGNPHVINAIQSQVENIAYAGPTMVTQIRAELGEMLAKYTPGDLNMFFFTLGGAEANENAIKLAKQYTGRQKIMARYRSYHAATTGAISLTGDPRRWANEPGLPGVIRVFDPYEYRCTFEKGGCEGCAMPCVDHIEEIIQYEGPDTIAAFFLETVTGTNGMIVPPPGYMKAVREICDKYGILMICDEVMVGLGRTGKWFAVDHWDVVPDIITMAKGLTASYLPLGCVAMSEKISAHFGDKVFYGGLTYNAHPMCMAAAKAVLEVLEQDDLIGNSERMGKVMAELLAGLKEKHPSVGDVRSLGLFGGIEIVKNRETKEMMAPFNGTSEPMNKLGAFLRQQGVSTMIHWNKVFTTPPLIINEQQLREVFAILDQGLEITDQAYEA